ncbi:hypothetical protein PsAD5_00125 [Pseudovibrio sp. Ad5]|nr:hypothetical protein PsAD5_00125 [Pseudovibrio sp. Ad5]
MTVTPESTKEPRTLQEQVDELTAVTIRLLSILNTEQIERLRGVKIPMIVREGRPPRTVNMEGYLPQLESLGANA